MLELYVSHELVFLNYTIEIRQYLCSRGIEGWPTDLFPLAMRWEGLRGFRDEAHVALETELVLMRRRVSIALPHEREKLTLT